MPSLPAATIAVTIIAAAAIALPIAARAASPFDGTWKEDVASTTAPTKPEAYKLKGGLFTALSGEPPFTVKADGADHAVKGIPYLDTVAVTVTSDHAVTLIGKKAAKTVAEIDYLVAPDGQTLVENFSNSFFAAPMKGSTHFARVAAGAPGSHALAGSWHQTSLAALSDNAVTETLSLAAGTLAVTTPLGTSFTAKIGGADAPYTGDPGITTVTVRQLGSHSLFETDKRHGKVVDTLKRTISADGKTLAYAYTDTLGHASNTWTATKQ